MSIIFSFWIPLFFFLIQVKIVYNCFCLWFTWTTFEWCNKYTAILSDNSYHMRGENTLWVSNIAVYFYTFRHNERHNGRPSFIAVIIYNQWDIIIIVEKIKSINAAAATSSSSLFSSSSSCYSFCTKLSFIIFIECLRCRKWFHYAAASAFFSCL